MSGIIPAKNHHSLHHPNHHHHYQQQQHQHHHGQNHPSSSFGSKLSSRYIENQRRFVDDDLCKKMKIMEYSQWYQVGLKDISQHGGLAILFRYYNGFPSQMLETIYPEYNWIPWLFESRVPERSWNEIENQRLFIHNHLRGKLAISEYTQWYRMSQRDLILNYGASNIFNFYNGSPLEMLETIYPEYNWIPWLFQSGVPQGYWDEIEHQRLFINNHLSSKLAISEYLQWYQVSARDISKHGGSGMFHSYNGSPLEMLERVYPEYNWIPWHFESAVPQRFWKDIGNFRRYMDSQLKDNEILEWNHNNNHHHDNGMSSPSWKLDFCFKIRTQPQFWCLWKYHSNDFEERSTLIETIYPEFDLEKKSLSWFSSRGEYEVWKNLLEVFGGSTNPGYHDWRIHYKHPFLVHSHSGRQMEFDFFNIEMQVAIEYQGLQHYRPMGFRSEANAELHDQRIRDEEKRQECLKHNIALIEIDCRVWDGIPQDQKANTLYTAIIQRRNTLLK